MGDDRPAFIAAQAHSFFCPPIPNRWKNVFPWFWSSCADPIMIFTISCLPRPYAELFNRFADRVNKEHSFGRNFDDVNTSTARIPDICKGDNLVFVSMLDNPCPSTSSRLSSRMTSPFSVRSSIGVKSLFVSETSSSLSLLFAVNRF